MKTLAAVVVSVCLLTGCTTSRGAWTGVGLGVAIAAIGGGIALVEDSQARDRPNNVGPAGLLIVVPLGGLIALASLINVVVLEGRDAIQEETARVQAEPARIESEQAQKRADLAQIQSDVKADARATRDRRREIARALIKTATAAARDGHCDTVRKIDRQVLAIDSDVHTTEFLVDAGITACLSPAPVPSTPTP